MVIILYKEKQSNGLRIKPVSHAEAKKLQLAMQHPERVTDEAVRLKLASIKAVYLSRESVAEDYGLKTNSGMKG